MNPSTPQNSTAPRVCAVVVTFNRPKLLRRCLEGLQAQTRPVDSVLVVDNASTDDTREIIKGEFAWCQLLELPQNVGGSGGFHAGVKRAFDDGFDWIWLMDDDGTPALDCLEQLFGANGGEVASDKGAVMVPVQQDSSGAFYGFARWKWGEQQATDEIMDGCNPLKHRHAPVFRFVGPLISREVVSRVGLPRGDFFIWFDDIEYALRIHKRSRTRVRFVPQARFFHDFGPPGREVSIGGKTKFRGNQPPWKLYYLSRNQLVAMRQNHHPLGDFLHFFFPNQLRNLIGELLYDPDGRVRVSMRLRGMRDGILGKMGKRVEP